ncbi:expressed unknown protein [Seminavis robusta]|uniref:Uncharacterized protein n=1 Tax=Seminavis robusta TaxID=568900 RepID=A0A9N8E9A6_9STRA|nr:expressed unknown protein [Seminavis robusta]|eukprot:Sro691_g187830.1 n/a (136) ;mRNA; r:20594-21001
MKMTRCSLLTLILLILCIQPVQSLFQPAKHNQLQYNQHDLLAISLPRGGGMIPAGYNPFGYKITELGEQFLSYDGSLESDVGRVLASLKSSRKTFSTLKDQWLEVLRVSKSGQNMRIYRLLRELVDFCLAAGLVD